MVDMVVHRHQLRDTVSRVIRILTKSPPFLKNSINGEGEGNDSGSGTALVPAS
jgi:hypothetical protein